MLPGRKLQTGRQLYEQVGLYVDIIGTVLYRISYIGFFGLTASCLILSRKTRNVG